MAQEQPFDVAVIGGGIHGVGVAQAAAAAGYRVAVFEQTALAAGTSSRSSKLIHGGLRYLESGQFFLVRKSLNERALLLELAPRLVRPVPFYLPVYRHTRRRPWQIRIGLMLYAVLAGLGRHARFTSVPRSQWPQLEGLVTEGLQKVFRYWDAQTDDRKLTEAVMRSAQVLGAVLHCPARVTGITLQGDTYAIDYNDGQGGQHSLNAKTVVNAAGPWVNHVLECVQPKTQALPVDLVQGTHIVVKGSVHDKVFYLEAPADGRAVFVMPWQGNTLVGTTEHVYEGDPGEVATLDEEVNYLLDTLTHYFPQHPTEVLEKFAGLRVLPKHTSAVFHRPRETTLHVDPAYPCMITIYGGKLTGYRATAEEVMKLTTPLLGTRKRKGVTANIQLTACTDTES